MLKPLAVQKATLAEPEVRLHTQSATQPYCSSLLVVHLWHVGHMQPLSYVRAASRGSEENE